MLKNTLSYLTLYILVTTETRPKILNGPYFLKITIWYSSLLLKIGKNHKIHKQNAVKIGNYKQLFRSDMREMKSTTGAVL